MGNKQILILCATKQEQDKILRSALVDWHYNEDDDVWYSDVDDECYDGHSIYLSVIGIGKVEATMNTVLALSLFRPDIVINVGVCGGSAEAFKHKRVAEVGLVVNNDFDTSEVDGTPFYKPFVTLHKDCTDPLPCFTQDHFCVNNSDIAYSIGGVEDYVVDNIWYVDMESFAVASVCNSLGYPVKIIKAISDVVGSGQQGKDFGDFDGVGFDRACDLAATKLKGVLSESIHTVSEE